jgi:hypothetical protein
MERGGDEEIVKLLRDIRQNQKKGGGNPKGGGFLTKIPIVGACIGMIPLVDKIPVLGPMCFGKADHPDPSGQISGTYTPWNEDGCFSGKIFGASCCGIAFKKPQLPCCNCNPCGCIKCSLPILCNPELEGVGFDCPWAFHLCLPQLTCCHVSMRIPVFHLLGWNPGCMCCMEGCGGIPISFLPCFCKTLSCGQYEDIDGNANRDVKGGETAVEAPIADTAVEAAIEAQV